MTRLPKFWRPREESSEVKPAIRPAPRGLAPTVAGLLVGVQAALLSWVVVVIPTVATFTTTSGLAVNAGVSWADAGRFGSSLWVLGHGGWTVVGQGASSALVSVSPLGIALISVLACAALSHATAARGWPLVLGGLAGFLAMAVLVVLVLGRNQSGAAPAALFGAAVTALVGLLWGNQPHNGELLGRWRELLAAGIAPEVMAALRAAGLAALVLLAASSGLILILVLGGQGRFRELFNSLGADPVGAVALILLSAALIPNLLAWGVAYLSGLGFVVGQGTGFSPFHTWGGAEPAWPILGFLPTTAPPAVAIALVLIPVFAGALAGWWLHQTLGATRHWWQTALTSVSCGLVAALGLSVLVVWSGGSGGPGRLALVGAAWWPLVGWLALELGVGACAASLLLRLRQGQKNVEGTKHV